jgi:hypothetical protein
MSFSNSKNRGNRFSPLASGYAVGSAGRISSAVLDNGSSQNLKSKNSTESPTRKNAPKKMKIDANEVTESGLTVDDITNSVHASQEHMLSVDASGTQPIELDSYRPSDTQDRQPVLPTGFPASYAGRLIIILSSNSNTIKIHPISVGKCLTKNFNGVLTINSAGPNQVKVTFDSIKNANLCISSPLLESNGFKATIPNSLLFCFGVIKLDNSISEDDFWDGLESQSKVLSFRRINVKRDGSSIPSRFVELKFLASSLPKKISIFKVLFHVQPSVRSPTQCNKCLRFGHTQKFCRGKLRCSHCGERDHDISSCEVLNSSMPVCVNCKLHHLATDRSCSEWASQKEIKRIMACENISFREAAQIRKSATVNSAYSYADKVSSSNNSNFVREPELSQSLSPSSFPPVSSINTRQKKHKTPHSPISRPNFPTIPVNPSSSLPNGSFLEYVNSNNITKDLDSSWIASLAYSLSQTLSNSLDFTSSPSSLNSLIESSIINILSSMAEDDETF